jgi:Flp pilus assembly protein TadD
MRQVLLTVTVTTLLAATACGGLSKAKILEAQREGEALRVDLAETYVEKGAFDAATPLLVRAVAELPDEPRVRFLYGVVLREKRLYPQAERELRKAVTLAPGYARAWDGLGVLYDLWRRPADAEAAHRRAVELAPDVAAYWNNLGFSLYVAGKTDDAILALEQALALDPSLVQAYNNLGFAYGRRGDMTAAERCFRAAGSEPMALVNLALVFEERGDAGRAEALRAEAAELDPSLEEVP